MKNSILFIGAHNPRDWDPTQAEVKFLVMTQDATASTEIRGRLVGPHCPYATTVEVAYPLRADQPVPIPPIPRRFPRGFFPMRVIIPEPSLWEPECPFLYDGAIELWQDGERCDQVHLRHALRRLQLKDRGVLLNGRPLILRGLARNTCSEDDARQYRQVGCNLLVADATVGCETLWNEAERLGFFMIGRLASPDRHALRHIVMSLLRKTINFGWLVPQDVLEDPEGWGEILRTVPHKYKRTFGVELRRVTYPPLLKKIGFIVCPASLLPELTDIDLPKIILGPLPPKDVGPPPGILGWIDVQTMFPGISC